MLNNAWKYLTDPNVSTKAKIFHIVFYIAGISSLVFWFLVFAIGLWQQIDTSGLVLDLGTPTSCLGR